MQGVLRIYGKMVFGQTNLLFFGLSFTKCHMIELNI